LELLYPLVSNGHFFSPVLFSFDVLIVASAFDK